MIRYCTFIACVLAWTGYGSAAQYKNWMFSHHTPTDEEIREMSAALETVSAEVFALTAKYDGWIRDHERAADTSAKTAERNLETVKKEYTAHLETVRTEGKKNADAITTLHRDMQSLQRTLDTLTRKLDTLSRSVDQLDSKVSALQRR
ncbi:MAG: hypothetical protein LIP77_12360 [Planctomycetes bacterium]|nr:hypothetical protein [Planctomycetota bacterium]